MPRRAASFGPDTVTWVPSNQISPSSAAWMPAMHLMSVDFPAPLSPTSAITSPSRTSRSTSVSACTDPNDLKTPRSSRRSLSLTSRFISYRDDEGDPFRGRLRRMTPLLLAVLGVVAVADVALLEEARREQQLVVRLRDRLRRDQVGLLDPAALRVHDAGGRDGLALDDRDRRLRCCGGELADVLEHRHRLPARDDVLHTLRAGILAAQRDRLLLLRLQSHDHRVRDAVVRRRDAVDLVTRLDEHLLEDGAGLLVVPTRHELI